MPFLTDLFSGYPAALQWEGDGSRIEVKGITSDSRHVKPGYVFAAIRGGKNDGTAFIADAIARGAAAIVCDQDAATGGPGEGAVRILAANPRLALACAAAAFYGRQPTHVAAITGTDGKTSTADFFRQLWHGMGKRSASVGTLGVIGGDGAYLCAGTHTTPTTVELHETLAMLAQSGVEYVGIEASSHGLDQYRLHGTRVQAAAFTNLARDHLDYHVTVDAYFAAKLRLFSEVLQAGGTAVINADDARARQVEEAARMRGCEVLRFGRNGEELKIRSIVPTSRGQHSEVTLLGRNFTWELPLYGGFQLWNILAALGLGLAMGAPLAQAAAVASGFRGVPGRLEKVCDLASGATIFVDYAHTPMALSNVLSSLRPHAQGKLHVVFGCGGERDTGKRPEMGRIAATLADELIVTDDNPRSEDPALIRKAVLAAAARGKEVADRREAIYVAVGNLIAGDILVIAGKGHETTQIIGDRTLPFNDAEVARDAVRILGKAA